jgi:hypothetical protein
MSVMVVSGCSAVTRHEPNRRLLLHRRPSHEGTKLGECYRFDSASWARVARLFVRKIETIGITKIVTTTTTTASTITIAKFPGIGTGITTTLSDMKKGGIGIPNGSLTCEGFVLTPEMRRAFRPGPPDLYRQFPPPPAGYCYVVIGDHVCLVNRSYRIHDVLHFELNF